MPVLDQEGAVALVIQRIEDVTEIVRLRRSAGAQDQLARDQHAAHAVAHEVSVDLRRKVLARFLEPSQDQDAPFVREGLDDFDR